VVLVVLVLVLVVVVVVVVVGKKGTKKRYTEGYTSSTCWEHGIPCCSRVSSRHTCSLSFSPNTFEPWFSMNASIREAIEHLFARYLDEVNNMDRQNI